MNGINSKPNLLKNKNHFLILFLILLLSAFSCKNDPLIPKPQAKLTLAVEEVSCTEAWFNLKLENVTLPVNLELKSDTSILKTYTSINSIDTVLYVGSLLPNQSYNLQVSSNQHQVSSNELIITTMDTTSHNFSWETFTFGGGGEASFINDVTIIDENNIWAVGEIYLPDSLGNPDNKLYNALHWGGDNWQPKRISAEFRGNIITPAIVGAQAFSATDIWFTSSLPIHGDGTTWKIFDIRTTTDPNLVTSKCWGTSSINMYFVGALGSIAYYNGQNFSKIESGTATIINDVWGIVSGNNETTAYCPVSSFFTQGDKRILKIKNNMVDSVSWNMSKLLYSVWTNSERYLYVCGSGAFENKNNIWKEFSLPSLSMNRIRGNGTNDILITGDFGLVAHFNGIGWNIYNDVSDAGYSGLAVKDHIVVIVGQRNGLGVITIGRRN